MKPGAAPAGHRQRLDVLLVELGLAPSRERARARILAGDVVVDDHRVDKPGTAVPRAAHIRLKGQDLRWVSRGGLKLDHALSQFGVVVAGRVAVDVGASTGGFTDVLLQRGAVLVHAVDVGWGQLAEALRRDPRVRNLERTHVKDLGPLEPVPGFACVDVSFISLRRVLPDVLRVLARPADIVALVKPQFEAGRGAVGSGGIVREPAERERALREVREAAVALGLVERGVVESPVTGQKGNVEFLVHWEVPA
ncbi:MAG: TlyA family RNA methyltransferase [Deltaproteobacteria bacterium]|nr:TlyA family RNA methyltransferase [Deltaproteobacteria bacterium]